MRKRVSGPRGKYKIADVTNPILKTWVALNSAIMHMSEDECKALLEEELSGRARKNFVKRIHCRLNKIRAHKEREELGV